MAQRVVGEVVDRAYSGLGDAAMGVQSVGNGALLRSFSGVLAAATASDQGRAQGSEAQRFGCGPDRHVAPLAY
jgi:hypothetical protein